MHVLSKETFRFYWKHLSRYPFLTGFAVFGSILAVSVSMLVLVYLKNLVDFFSASPAPEYYAEGLRIFMVMIGLMFVDWMGHRIRDYLMPILQPCVMKNIANECFRVLHQHSFNFFNNEFVGSLVKRVNRMIRAFEELTDQLFYQWIPMVVRVLIVLAFLFILDLRLGLLLLIWLTIYVGVHLAISRYKLERYDLPKSKADTAITARLADTISNHLTLKLFARESFEQKEFDKVSSDWSKKLSRSWFFNSHIEAVQGFFMILLNAVVLYAALQMWIKGELTVGTFVLLQTYLWELFMQIWDFARILRHYYEHLADANEMTAILILPFEVKNRSRAKPINMRRGEVLFDHVSFSYTGEEEHEVIRNLSFKVKPCERIALIGPSGGGKTTIVKLLLRLFDVDKGHIFIDGQDISSVTQQSLRSQIALVPQDPVLFHRSLTENIRYGRLEASNDEVIEAAKQARCHDFISHFPHGYETHVGERGVKLSGGERQRVAIARALLADTKILVLDEATSSLDSESEKLIKEALKVLMKGKTVFVIAHRLSTIMDTDRILVLEKGRIVEEGGHHDLIKKEAGLYKKLWNLQVGGYLK